MSGSQQLILGAGAGSSIIPNYIEDVFSTWIYAGNGSTQTINNGIDLAGKGGMVWLKSRSAADPAWIMDTARGTSSTLQPSNSNVAGTISNAITSFNSNGFSLGSNFNSNTNGNTYVGWTFRKQPKFFDIVTYTGDNNSDRAIPHNLGSAPGCIIIKRVSGASGVWVIGHRSLGSTGGFPNYLLFNTSAVQSGSPTILVGSNSTTFTIGGNQNVNGAGATFVAYLFAHDAGGFGLTGTDSVVSCGAYTGNGSTIGPTVTLGYEPQWVMIKNASGTGSWQILDTMRGLTVAASGRSDSVLQANSTSTELPLEYVTPNATGFQIVSTSSEVNTSSSSYIYIAIRRGPMRIPTTGASVFALATRTGTGSTTDVTMPITAPDMYLSGSLDGGGSFYRPVIDRLRGNGRGIETYSTNAESNINISFIGQATGSIVNFNANTQNNLDSPYVDYYFRRAPGFFDVVCYTGNGSANPITHNLGVTPEMIIIKNRTSSAVWDVWTAANWGILRFLNLSNAGQSSGSRFSQDPSATTIYLDANAADHNAPGNNYVTYLFATLAGVSKVGTYTGNGSSQTINCGFTGGARFVLIKRTDSTGDWYVWDTARGIVAAGGDPALFLNSTAAEQTVIGGDVDPHNTGFIVLQNGITNINVSGATYIFLAIA